MVIKYVYGAYLSNVKYAAGDLVWNQKVCQGPMVCEITKKCPTCGTRRRLHGSRQPLGLVPILVSGLPERLRRVVVQAADHCRSARDLQLEVRRHVNELFNWAFGLAKAAGVCRRRVGRGRVQLLRPGQDPADGGEYVWAMQELVIVRPELNAPARDGDLLQGGSDGQE